MAAQANKPQKTIRVPSEILKKNQKDVDKMREAEQTVLADPFLRKLYSRDKVRQQKSHKGAVDLWWDRGQDVISVRRANTPEDAEVDEESTIRAPYGNKSVSLLARALGLDHRAFHRAADFVLLFDEDADKRVKFFDKLAKDHGEDAVPTWTHVEVMLKKVVPSHKDKSDEVFADLLTTAARERLSTRAFGDMLDKRFKNTRAPKRKVGPREAIRALDAALSKALETVGPALTLAADTIGDSPSEVVDPQAVRAALLQTLSKVTDFARVVGDGEQRLVARSEELRGYIDSLPAPAAPADEPEADPETPAADATAEPSTAPTPTPVPESPSAAI